jgi:peroxiredoxin
MAANRLLQPGDQAPDFALFSVQEGRTVSLADYRGRSNLLLGLFTGLYCPFCRRAIVQMSDHSEKLKPLGIESLAVVATDLENARLYFKFRPTKLPLAADPDLTTHRSYGVPRFEFTPEAREAAAKVKIDPGGELPEPLPVEQAFAEYDKMDRATGFEPTASDHRDYEHQFGQLKGQFMIDRDSVIRWANIEGARQGLEGIGKFPTYDELVAAADVNALR